MTGMDKMIGSSLIATFHAQLSNFCPAQISGFMVRVSGALAQPAQDSLFAMALFLATWILWWAMVARGCSSCQTNPFQPNPNQTITNQCQSLETFWNKDDSMIPSNPLIPCSPWSPLLSPDVRHRPSRGQWLLEGLPLEVFREESSPNSNATAMPGFHVLCLFWGFNHHGVFHYWSGILWLLIILIVLVSLGGAANTSCSSQMPRFNNVGPANAFRRDVHMFRKVIPANGETF